MSWSTEVTIGELRPWPEFVQVVRGNTEETRIYVPECTASIVKVPHRSHVALGHYECGECGASIDAGDCYCRHCGSKLKGANQ